MRITVVSVMTMLLLCAPLSAGVQDKYTTVSPETGLSFRNGEYWNLLNSREKYVYLHGLAEGLALFSTAEYTFSDAPISPADARNMLNALGWMIPGKMSYQEMVKYLDSYYSAETHLNVPVTTAYAGMVFSRAGLTPEQGKARIREYYKK